MMKVIYRWRRRILAGGLLLLLTGVVVFWIRQPADPAFNGKPLSEHLYALTRPVPAFRGRPTAAQLKELEKYNSAVRAAFTAIEQLGTNSLPLLLAWLDADEYVFKKKLSTYLQTNNIEMPFLTAPKRRLALMAFQQIPQHATSAIPKMIELAIEDKERQLALSTLGQMLVRMPFDEQAKVLEGAKSYTEKLLTSMDERGNRWIFERHLDPYGHIGNVLNLESGEVPRQTAGAMFFREQPILPERVVPLLSQSLASTNKALVEAAARALGEYGYKAHSALPALSPLTNHNNRFVANAAAKSVAKIQEASALAQIGRNP